MEAQRFAAWIRALRAATSRRTTLRGLAAAVLAAPLAHLGPEDAVAKKKHRRRKRKRRHKRKNKRHKGPCGDVCASGCPFSSVREAIEAATEGATLRLCAGTHGGPLSIAKDVTLIGAGAGEDGAILDGQGIGVVVDVASGVTVMLEGLRIIGGNGEGGGIHNRGALTLTNDTVTGNVADEGGGIYNDTTGILTLIDCSVTDNVVSEFGGGIYNKGAAILSDCSVTDNASGLDGGGIYNDTDATITLDGTSSVAGNVAFGGGGGIYNAGDVTLNDDSSVTENESNNCDGPGTFNGNACGP